MIRPSVLADDMFRVTEFRRTENSPGLLSFNNIYSYLL